MATKKQIQQKLADLGLYHGEIDGKIGPKSRAAIRSFQEANGLYPDSIVGPRTLAVLFPPRREAPPAGGGFDASSARNLSKAHPLIQKVMNEARREVVFRVLDSSRGKAAQEKAYREGRSQARYGKSAHNWTPAVAVDLFPAPYSWSDIPAFNHLAEVVLRIAQEMKVPLRWGGDWNRDGDKTKTDSWDKPHFELHPWRNYAEKLYA